MSARRSVGVEVEEVVDLSLGRVGVGEDSSCAGASLGAGVEQHGFLDSGEGEGRGQLGEFRVLLARVCSNPRAWVSCRVCEWVSTTRRRCPNTWMCVS